MASPAVISQLRRAKKQEAARGKSPRPRSALDTGTGSPRSGSSTPRSRPRSTSGSPCPDSPRHSKHSPLAQVFRSFCAFGNKGSTDHLMDGAKFAKLTRDACLLDKNLTPIDVDIIYTKCKPRSERKITYKQFQEALKMLADKKYPGDEKGYQKIKDKILEMKGPVASGTRPGSSSVVDRLTDTSKYTGSHKLRFDESGKGLGKAGRQDEVDKSGYVVGYKDKGTYETAH